MNFPESDIGEICETLLGFGENRMKKTDTWHEETLCFCMNLEQNLLNAYRRRNMSDKCCWEKR